MMDGLARHAAQPPRAVNDMLMRLLLFFLLGVRSSSGWNAMFEWGDGSASVCLNVDCLQLGV